MKMVSFWLALALYYFFLLLVFAASSLGDGSGSVTPYREGILFFAPLPLACLGMALGRVQKRRGGRRSAASYAFAVTMGGTLLLCGVDWTMYHLGLMKGHWAQERREAAQGAEQAAVIDALRHPYRDFRAWPPQMLAGVQGDVLIMASGLRVTLLQRMPPAVADKFAPWALLHAMGRPLTVLLPPDAPAQGPVAALVLLDGEKIEARFLAQLAQEAAGRPAPH